MGTITDAQISAQMGSPITYRYSRTDGDHALAILRKLVSDEHGVHFVHPTYATIDVDDVPLTDPEFALLAALSEEAHPTPPPGPDLKAPDVAWFDILPDGTPEDTMRRLRLPAPVELVHHDTVNYVNEGLTFLRVWVKGAPVTGQCQPTFTIYANGIIGVSVWT